MRDAAIRVDLRALDNYSSLQKISSDSSFTVKTPFISTFSEVLEVSGNRALLTAVCIYSAVELFET